VSPVRVRIADAPLIAGPTSGVTAQLGTGQGVFAYSNVKVTSVGAPATTAGGLAAKAERAGAALASAVTVAEAVAVPLEFAQVRTKVPLDESVTVVTAPLTTTPTPPSIVQLGAGVGAFA